MILIFLIKKKVKVLEIQTHISPTQLKIQGIPMSQPTKINLKLTVTSLT